jgi:hypothetical protein
VQKKIILCIAAISLAIGSSFLAGCGSTSATAPSGSAGETPAVVTMHDTPPAGVTVLSFAVEVTGLTLTGSGSANASLVSQPVTMQLEGLTTTSDILTDTSVAAGTYSGMTMTFANPAATIQNNSGSSITVGSTTCANGQVCQITPSLTAVSATVTTAPFPLTLTADTPVNLAIDFNIASSLQANLSVTPTITVTASTTAQADSNLADFTNVTGQVTSVGSNQFTITDSNTGNSLQLDVNSNTQYQNYTLCTADNFSCVQAHQIVSVDFGASDGDPTVLTASSVSLESNFTQSVEGTVVAVNSASNQFTMVVTGMAPALSGVTAGQELTVTAAAGATFSVSPTTVTIPSGLVFQSISNVTVGQTVQADATSVSGAALTADQVLLSPGPISGNLEAVTGQDLTINGLNGLFVGAGTNTILVATGSGTQFIGVSGVSGLTTGTAVETDGLLFEGTSGAVLVAEQVEQTQ